MEKIRTLPLREITIKTGCDCHEGWSLQEQTAYFLDASDRWRQSVHVCGNLVTKCGLSLEPVSMI